MFRDTQLTAFAPPAKPLTRLASSSRTCPALPTRRAFSGRSVLPPRAEVRSHGSADGVSSRRGVLMFEESGVADEEDEEEDETIELRDKVTNRTLQCGIEQALYHEGSTYLLCYPVDDAVAIACGSADPESDALVSVEDPAQIDVLFPEAERVLAEEDIVLHNSAFVLTADDMGEVEEDEEEETGDEDEDEDEDEEVEVMAQFEHDGETFLVVKPMFPVLLIARENGEEYDVLQGEELDRVSNLMDERMQSELVGESVAQ